MRKRQRKKNLKRDEAQYEIFLWELVAEGLATIREQMHTLNDSLQEAMNVQESGIASE
jgi:hypothetical protein